MNIQEAYRTIYESLEVNPRPGYWGIHLTESGSKHDYLFWAIDQASFCLNLRYLIYFMFENSLPHRSNIHFLDQLVDQYEHFECSLRELENSFNEHFGFDWQISWCGSIEELCSLDTKGARYLRYWFWRNQESEDDEEKEPDDYPHIPEELFIEFTNYLSSWNML